MTTSSALRVSAGSMVLRSESSPAARAGKDNSHSLTPGGPGVPVVGESTPRPAGGGYSRRPELSQMMMRNAKKNTGKIKPIGGHPHARAYARAPVHDQAREASGTPHAMAC
jgi:hypothetical protein